MQFRKIFQFILLLAFFSANIYAQPGINSIYSSYGVGDVMVRDNNSYTSMGGVGVAIASDRMLNCTNPASYAAIPRGSYVTELSFSGKSIQYTNETQSFKSSDFVLNGAALGFSISKKMGGAVSLKRYSEVEYYTLANRFLQGSNSTLAEDITGTGGLYLATAGIGYKLTKNLSLGISGGSIFGSVNKKENIYLSSTSGFTVDNNSFYNNFYSNAGLQLKFRQSGINWIVGSIIQPSIKLNKYDDYSIKDFSGNVLYQETAKHSRFEYPLQWGVGISAQKLFSTISVDYIRQNWGSTNYIGNSFSTKDLQNIAIGYRHTSLRKLYNRYVDGKTWMLGLQHENSYIVINNYQVQSFAATAGITLPSKNGRFNYTFGLKYGQRGKVVYPLVKESFVELNIAISLGNFINVGGAKYF
jgi:hypothetical protein